MHMGFNSSRYHASLIITTSFSSHAKSIPYPSSTIHESCQAYIIFHYIHVSHHNVHSQTNTNHPRTYKHPNSTLPRPTLRSGWRVSLRRDELAQASPLRLGEGSKEHPETNAGSRLGETPLAWATCLLAQKFERVTWATFRANWFGRLPVCLA